MMILKADHCVIPSKGREYFILCFNGLIILVKMCNATTTIPNDLSVTFIAHGRMNYDIK